jgi:hypothetical protein
MAEWYGIGKDTVARIWRKHDLKPWQTDTFKVSKDPDFETKLVDVVGLYLDPPDRAVVFSFDEKTQVQALDRTQPSLSMIKGRAGTMTHDYRPGPQSGAGRSPWRLGYTDIVVPAR